MERNTPPTTFQIPATSVSRRIMNFLIDTAEVIMQGSIKFDMKQ